MSLKNLEEALSWNIHEDEVKDLARILDSASKTGGITYQEVERGVENPERVLLLAEEKRLLIPKRTSRSESWEDRVLLFEHGECYEMPRVIKYLVRSAGETGNWDMREVTTELFREMGEEASEKFTGLIESLEKRAEKCKVSASQIKEVCREIGLENKVNTIIAELKGAGVISPKPSEMRGNRLKSFRKEGGESSPVYELNPLLLVGDREDHRSKV